MRFSILKKIQLIRDDPFQRRLLGLAAAVVALFILFGIFIYIPSRSQMVVLRSDLRASRARLHGLQALVGMGGNIREGIRLVKERSSQLEEKFPKDQNAGLQLIPVFASKLGIDVVTLKHFDAAPYPDAGHPLLFEGHAVYYVPVSMAAKGTFKDIAELVRLLRTALPGFLYVDTLTIGQAGSEDVKLDAVLDFKLFFLAQANGK